MSWAGTEQPAALQTAALHEAQGKHKAKHHLPCSHNQDGRRQATANILKSQPLDFGSSLVGLPCGHCLMLLEWYAGSGASSMAGTEG